MYSAEVSPLQGLCTWPPSRTLSIWRWDGLSKDQLCLTTHDAHAKLESSQSEANARLPMLTHDAPAECSCRRARGLAAAAVGCCGRDAAGTSAAAVGWQSQPADRPIAESSIPTAAKSARRVCVCVPQRARRTGRAAAADAAGRSGQRPPAATRAGRACWATAREAERSAAPPMCRTNHANGRPRQSRRSETAPTAPAAGPPATATGSAPAGSRRGPPQPAGVHRRHQAGRCSSSVR